MTRLETNRFFLHDFGGISPNAATQRLLACPMLKIAQPLLIDPPLRPERELRRRFDGGLGDLASSMKHAIKMGY